MGAITLQVDIYPMNAKSFERGGGDYPTRWSTFEYNGPMTLGELAKRRAELDK